MIVREPFEIAYLRNQEQRESAEDQQAEAWGFDRLTLEEMVKSWGIKTILHEIADIHERISKDGSKVQWAIPSRAYLSGHYDNPNPCDCEF